MKKFLEPEVKVYEIAAEAVTGGDVSMTPGADDGNE